MYGRLNLITLSFISVLLGLGIDFPVHLFVVTTSFGASRKHCRLLRESLMNRAGIVNGAYHCFGL